MSAARLRDAFEKWAVAERCYVIDRNSRTGHYLDMATRVAWGAWQAAYADGVAAGIAQAIKACESLTEGAARDDCVAAIKES